MVRKLVAFLFDFSGKMKKQDITTFAASTAFFFWC